MSLCVILSSVDSYWVPPSQFYADQSLKSSLYISWTNVYLAAINLNNVNLPIPKFLLVVHKSDQGLSLTFSGHLPPPPIVHVEKLSGVEGGGEEEQMLERPR